MSRVEIKNLKKAAERIKKAVKEKERIILYGDADLDGVSAVIILKEAIKNLGVHPAGVHIYFPDRETEGYGINKDALDYLKKYAPALLVALDCGIGNFEEIKLAKSLGFEVVIIDHHKVLGKLPIASLVVNPHQGGDKYPFKEFATGGIVFKLAEVLLGKKLTPSLKKNFLELAALATLADMMPQEEDNAEFLEKGLVSLKNTVRPGLKIFWQLNSIDKNNVRQFAQKVITACHSGGTKNHLNEGYLLLTSVSEKEAENLAKDLLEKSYLRQQRIKEIVQEVEERALAKSEEPIIFEGSTSWPILMVGPAASKIVRICKKPVFLYSRREKDSQGAVRTLPGIDGVRAMIRCSKFLETYGGHPQAAGFRIKNENLEKFKKCLIKYFQE